MNRHVLVMLRRHASSAASSKSFVPGGMFKPVLPSANTMLDSQNSCRPNGMITTGGPITASASAANPISSNNNNHQIRHFGSDRSLRRNKRRKVSPFKVLKVRRTTPYATVKTIFLKLAMQHHPDVAGAKSEEEQEKSRELFIQARQAFEALVEDPETGGICLVEELPDYVADDEHDKMDEWFKQETGYDMPFMDEATMKEVAAMTEAVGGGGMDRGLDRDGGMWELARMVTRTVKTGGDGKNLLRLEQGEVKEININNSNLRARRRRAR